MYSISFPSMFSSAKTKLVSDHQATAQNLLLLLKSDRTSLFGDPYFGTILKRFLYNQNDIIVQDLIIDEIYTSIITFMPQILIKRSDISIYAEKENIYAKIYCVNKLDYQPNLYSIKLTNTEED